MKRIILCADDYGQNHAISQAIIKLLQLKRLTAVSCLTTSPAWVCESEHLESFKNQIDIGLHLNLTEGNSLYTGKAFSSLPHLIMKAHLRMLNKTLIEKELNTQLDAFVEKIGTTPQFLDGHQHVHHFPGIREIIYKMYSARLNKHHSYVRSVYQTNISRTLFKNVFIKNLIIQLTGAASFKKLLTMKKIPHNVSFAGIYDFSIECPYIDLFNHFLRTSKDNGIIMCHPGASSVIDTDVIVNSRVAEFEFLASNDFLESLERNHVKLSRFVWNM